MKDQQLTYRLNVYPFETTDGVQWAADFVDIPECGGGGETPEKAVKVAYKNLEVYLKVLREDGIEIPEPTPKPTPVKCSGNIALRIEKSQHEQILEISKIENVSMNQLLRRFISDSIIRYQYSSGVEKAIRDIAENFAASMETELNRRTY